MGKANWRTIAIAVFVGLAWVGLLVEHAHVPVPVLVVGLALVAALYGSLQHEVIHGHLPTWMAWLPLGVLFPFWRYRATHLDHHRNQLLTDPLTDPETFYVTAQHWASASAAHRWLLLASRTLAGRMLLGPLLFNARFVWNEIRCARQHGQVRVWLTHVVSVAGVLAVVRATGTPLWIYVLGFVYGGASITLLRSFAEHRAVPEGTKSAIVRTNPVLGLLFLNNNLHHVHHAHPGAPWYELPGLSRLDSAEQLAADGAGLYLGYWSIVRRYGLRPFDHPVRPIDQTVLVSP